MAHFGILTGGGDAPGLNAVIRAVVRRSLVRGHTVTGILQGWKGLLEKSVVALDLAAVSGILQRGGTILFTSRTNPYKKPEDASRLKENFAALGLDALIACGGEDTLGVASRLHADGFPVIGVPKTIDNDLSGTDVTFGFDTAVSIATEAIDRLHTTAESHDRIIVVEVMGRHAGWIALHAGIAGGADAILIPEVPTAIERVVEAVQSRRKRGKNFSIVVVAEGALLQGGAASAPPGAPLPEAAIPRLDSGPLPARTNADVARDGAGVCADGPSAGAGSSDPGGGLVTKGLATDAFGHVRLGGIGETLASELHARTGLDARSVVLGHLQRGGTPTARDRVLGTLFGVTAADLADRRDFGTMAALRGDRVVAVPLAEGVAKIKTVDLDLFSIAETFFG